MLSSGRNKTMNVLTKRKQTEGLALANVVCYSYANFLDSYKAPAVSILPLQRHHFSLFLDTILEQILSHYHVVELKVSISASGTQDKLKKTPVSQQHRRSTNPRCCAAKYNIWFGPVPLERPHSGEILYDSGLSQWTVSSLKIWPIIYKKGGVWRRARQSHSGHTNISSCLRKTNMVNKHVKKHTGE